MHLGLDPGNDTTKIVGPFGARLFRSSICDWFERDIEEKFGQDDMEFAIEGRRGYAGTIATVEDEFGGGNMMGDTKAHEDAKIRMLLAIHRYCPNFQDIFLVTGQPIKKHKVTENIKIKEMLLGKKTYFVNNERKTFYIRGVEVAPEGSASIWVNPQLGKVRILDIGSGTVNAATLVDKRHINTQSTTFHFGMETIRHKDYHTVARGIIKNLTKLNWHSSDVVYICGGVAELIAPYIQEYFPKAMVIYPELRTNGKVKKLHPVFANAFAYHELAKGIYA